MPQVRRVRETKAEKAVVKWATEHGIRSRKMNGLGHAGWPDQQFFLTGGRSYLIEFKASGEDPRALQAENHEWLRRHGYDVEVHTKAEEAIAAIQLRLKKAKNGNS